MAVAYGPERRRFEHKMDVVIRIVHRVLNANPSYPFEMPQTAFGWCCRNHWKVSLENKFIKICVPPTPIVESHFSPSIGAKVFFAVPLVRAISGCARKLT